MRILKSHPLLRLLNSYLIDHSQPTNISYLWNFGSLLAICLVIQLATGITLAMHYNPNVLEAFNSIEHIMRDVENGWLIRYLHSNTASAFFFLVYLHIGRGFYYGSYRAPRTLAWTIGTVILILMIGTGFLGFLNIAQNELYRRELYNNNNNNKHNNNNNDTLENFRARRWNRRRVDGFTVEKEYLKSFYSKPFQFVTRKYSTYSRRLLSTQDRDDVSIFLKEKNLNPVFVYENLDKDLVRKEIVKETNGLSGIYLILNKKTMSYYIGSASTGRFNARFTNHLIYFRGNKLLKNAVNKYKLCNFSFIVLELFPDVVTQENNKKLLNLEDFYLKSLIPDYNILTEAGSSFGYKHTEVTRLKMKSQHSDERRNQIGNLNRGKNFSPDVIEAMRKAALSRDKIVYSEEALLNMKKKSRAIIVKELTGIVYGEYPSVVETAKAFDCNVKTVHRALKGETKLLKKRWVVSYA
jgi:group I intron endonuclease